MPRASSAQKRQGAANHRDTRHENGLVKPGKPVHRQKGNGHIVNAHANKSSESLPSTPPLPETPPYTNGHVRHPTLADQSAGYKMSLQTTRRASCSGFSESSSSEYNTPTIAVLHQHQHHRQIDVNAAKNLAVHRDAGPLNFAFTVLRSCPLYDTIAILIVLLQVPPAFLSIIHLLFASLTFVPPSITGTSGLSFTDIFEGTLGTPSVATIVVVDLIVLLVWLFLWGPLQDIALDLAQIVIALTLGGGTGGREAGTNNVLVCLGIIGVSHFARNGGVKQSSLRTILAPGGWFGTTDPDDPLEPIAPRLQRKGAPGWLRSILAIHILTQGVVRYIRDWYVRREKKDTSASIGDPEAAKGTLTDTQTDPSTPIPQTPDNESSISLLVVNIVSSKKKKKQSALVRIRQPLWAALASTKIVMVKEYETSHAAVESAGTNATDVNNLGNAPFSKEPDRIWICSIGSDEISFSTSYFPDYKSEGREDKSLDSSGIDKSKPFFVKVNKTIWQPTRISPVFDTEQPGKTTRWMGEIFGLAPMSNYEVNFVNTTTGDILFSTNIRTPQLPALMALSPNPAASGRPGSPTTTLKTSIATSESKLDEERSRQKRDRKDQKAKLNTLRKELASLAQSIATSGGNDDKLRQKVQQSQLHTKQAEDAVSTLTSAIDSLSRPQNLASSSSSSNTDWATQKFSFKATRDKHSNAQKDFNVAKTAAEEALSSLSNELASLQQKRERMQARIVKLHSEHERISDDNARDLGEASRRAARDEERELLETMYVERIQELGGKITEAVATIQGMCATIDQMQQMEIFANQQIQAQAQTQQAQQTHSPTASALSNLTFGAGNGGESSSSATMPEMASGPPSAATPNMSSYPWFASQNQTLAQPQAQSQQTNPSSLSSPWLQQGQGHSHRTRGRSSSMLSDVSGFAPSSAEGFGGGHGHLYGHGHGHGHQSVASVGVIGMGIERSASGSGSGGGGGGGSGHGSVGDPKSPVWK